jgi:hypothetical protein
VQADVFRLDTSRYGNQCWRDTKKYPSDDDEFPR